MIGKEEWRLAGNRHLAIRSGRASDQKVLVVAETERIAVITPQALHRLELPPDAGIEADKNEAAIDTIIFQLSIR